jgi:hypothetical protein
MSRPQFPDPLGRRELNVPGATAHKAGLTLEDRVKALEQGAAGRPGPDVSNGSVITSDTTQTGGVGWIKAGRAYIYRTAAQTISDASWTDIDMDATLYDSTGSMVSLASNTITVPRTGYYLVQCCLHWASTGTSLVNGCRVLTGSGGTVIETMKEKASIGLSATSVEGSRTLNIASGTTLKLQGYWDFSGAGSHNTVGGEAFTFLSVNYLGE